MSAPSLPQMKALQVFSHYVSSRRSELWVIDCRFQFGLPHKGGAHALVRWYQTVWNWTTEWSDLHVCSVDKPARLRNLWCFHWRGSLENNYLALTNFPFEDSLHLFPVKAGRAPVSDATVAYKQKNKQKKSATKQISHQVILRQAFSTYVFFPHWCVSVKEVRSISTGLGCPGKMIAFSNT